MYKFLFPCQKLKFSYSDGDLNEISLPVEDDLILERVTLKDSDGRVLKVFIYLIFNLLGNTVIYVTLKL